MRTGSANDTASCIDLYWLPLGAGGHSVRLNGRIYEALVSRFERRHACDLYHSALEVRVPEGRFVIEVGPPWAEGATTRGAVAQGRVGTSWAGRLRMFQYEVRRWRDGVIPDLAEAVDSPQRLSDSTHQARLLLDLVPLVPTPVWGRDELGTGGMWNSNSVISWLLATSGLPTEAIAPPSNGRAPGWDAGLVVARRESLLHVTAVEAGLASTAASESEGSAARTRETPAGRRLGHVHTGRPAQR